jgi:hypothetical protein
MDGIHLTKIQCEIGACCIGVLEGGGHNEIFQIGME